MCVVLAHFSIVFWCLLTFLLALLVLSDNVCPHRTCVISVRPSCHCRPPLTWHCRPLQQGGILDQRPWTWKWRRSWSTRCRCECESCTRFQTTLYLRWHLIAHEHCAACAQGQLMSFRAVTCFIMHLGMESTRSCDLCNSLQYRKVHNAMSPAPTILTQGLSPSQQHSHEGRCSQWVQLYVLESKTA